MNINERVKELEKQLEELKQEISKQDKKEHKSLSDYRVYEELGQDDRYKYIDFPTERIIEIIWEYDKFDNGEFKVGNVYSIDTPNELLERELKKRQLWFNLEKHLKEEGCLATSEDWKDEEKMKYSISYDIGSKTYDAYNCTSHKDNTIYSTDNEVLENYMNTLSEEDIKIMFDVEV